MASLSTIAYFLAADKNIINNVKEESDHPALNLDLSPHDQIILEEFFKNSKLLFNTELDSLGINWFTP